MTFPNLSCTLRTDESFKDLTDGHHLHDDQHSPLAEIGIGCVSKVPIDYMHNVLLGIMRTLLKRWMTDTSRFSWTLTGAQKQGVDYRLLQIKRQICSDFARTPRPLKDFKWFKATELRLMLLYTGPFVFKDIIDDRFYDNFIKLHAAIRILCDPEKCITFNSLAKEYLEIFANEFINLYGKQYFTYNFHVLTHLSSDSLRFGQLDKFSAFPFENYMQTMLRYIKKTSSPLQQFKNRLQEHLSFGKSTQSPIVRKKDGNLIKITNSRNTVISTDGNDSFVSNGSEIYKVSRIVEKPEGYVLICCEISNLMAIYEDPIWSPELGVYCSEQVLYSNEEAEIEANSVRKVLRLELDEITGFVVILHTNE